MTDEPLDDPEPDADQGTPAAGELAVSETEAAAPVDADVAAPAEGEAAAPADDDLEPTTDPRDLKPILEALIFASPDPLTLKEAASLLVAEASKAEVEQALTLLRHDYEGAGGLQLVEVAGGYQIVTRPELHEYVRRLFHERTSQKLSVPALETLAVIAYRQPVTAPEIAEIRGVNTSGVLNTLIGRKLVKVVGRKPVVGRPFMYGTTRDFLDKFGLNDLSDLPKVEDLADVLGFDPPALAELNPTEQPLAFDFGDAPTKADEAQ
ncbi:MAG: SMC-Scp complex subunit ScpB [Vicinamibacteraceae bacterium]